MDDSQNDSSEHHSQNDGARYKAPSDDVQREPPREYKYDNYYKDRREGQDQLQPQVQSTGKHWYDEYPIGDRRKLIEESIKEKRIKEEKEEQRRLDEEQRHLDREKKHNEFESYGKYEYADGNRSDESKKRQGIEPYPSSFYKKYEPNNEINDEAKYSQYEPQFINGDFRRSQQEFNPQNYDQEYIKRSPRENKYTRHRDASVDRQGFEDLVDTKHQSKSYNRSLGIHKRAFANPRGSHNDSKDFNNNDNERQIGRSASHGFDRQFRYNRQPVREIYQDPNEYRGCELKFNKKSINYDMSEIELPAYCKNHTDSKLLYIITPDGQESELGCKNCAMSVNKQKFKCSIIEVKDKLDDYIDNADKLLRSESGQGQDQVDPSMINKINACKDKEIAIIRQYYERVMDALKQERDNHIAEVEAITDQNSQTFSQSVGGVGGKMPKVDIKLNNFCIELGKVVEGVDETGIHIKELWKINQDYKDVVSQKFKDLQKPSQPKSGNMKSFEFQPAHEDILRNLAKRIGKVYTQNVSSDYFVSNASDYNQASAPADPKYDKYDRYNSDKYYEKYQDESKPQRSNDYKPIAAYERKSHSSKYEFKYSNFSYNDNGSKYQEYNNSGSQFDKYRNGAYDAAPSNNGLPYAVRNLGDRLENEKVELTDDDHRSIEEIKRKYANDKSETQKLNENDDDYKKEVEVIQNKPVNIEVIKQSLDDQFANSDLKDHNIKKLKTKVKGDKENVLKKIKVKLK